MRAIGLAVLALLFSNAALAEDVVVVCRLNLEQSWPVNLGRNDLLQKWRPIDVEFVIKFDDARQQVTYVGGPAILVVPSPEFGDRFQNQIVFQGDSIPIGAQFLRYSGYLDRLTAKIRLTTTFLRASDRQRDPSTNQTDQTGDCVAGRRKF